MDKTRDLGGTAPARGEDIASPERLRQMGVTAQEETKSPVIGYYRRPTLEETIDDLFTYHPPTPTQAIRYAHVREAAKYFAKVILSATPPGPDQTTAIRKLREVVMTANASIALEGRCLGFGAG